MKKLLCVVMTLAILTMMMSALPTTAFAAGKGDFNNDGRVDTLDVRLLLRAVVSKTTPTNKQLWWSDYDIDNKLSTVDARKLLREVITSSTSDAIDYAKPAADDWWGEKSVNLLGDSISFGAGAADPIPEFSYVSHVKRAVQAANGGNMNYGFESSCVAAWGNSTNNYTSRGVHDWSYTSGVWDDDDDGNRLLWYSMSSSTPWSTITYTLRKGTDHNGKAYDYTDDFNYFCVYYQVVSGGGMFCIADGNQGEVANIHGSKLYVDTATPPNGGATNMTYRTAFYPLADCPKNANGAPQIIISHDGTTKPVSITGIGYYKSLDEDVTTFNAYVRGGSSLSRTADHVLTQAATAQTLIFGLGYNDVYWHYTDVNNGVFKQKIDHLIEVCNENGTNVIITDHAWDNTTAVGRNSAQESAYQTVKAELKRFAQETGGIYIDQQGILGDDILNALNSTYEHNGNPPCDGVHPNSAGHKLIAQNIVSAMGLKWSDSWT